jgi:hypothetical protein
MARAIWREDALYCPGSPRENGYNKRFNGSLRDEMLNGEIFYSRAEAKELIGAWRRHYTTVLPYSSLGYRPPAPGSGDTLARRRAATSATSYDRMRVPGDRRLSLRGRTMTEFPLIKL